MEDLLFVEYSARQQAFHFITQEEMLVYNYQKMIIAKGEENQDWVPVFFGRHSDWMKFTEKMRQELKLPGITKDEYANEST